MGKGKLKRGIYLQNFVAFFTIYLVLMTGFSLYLINQENKMQQIELSTITGYKNNDISQILQNNLQEKEGEKKTADLPQIRKDLANRYHLFTNSDFQLAIYTGDYELVFHTNDDWVVAFTERKEGSTHYPGYAFLNLSGWFTHEDAETLKNYLTAQSKAKEIDDLSGYSIKIEGFWLDNEMVIPDKITVMPMFASRFDDGEVVSSYGTETDKIIFTATPQDTTGLPYFERGTIVSSYSKPRGQNQAILREIVLDKERLKNKIAQGEISQFAEKTQFLTYRYYTILPYQNTIRVINDGEDFYSEFWTVFAQDVDLLPIIIDKLVFLWLSSLVAFFIPAFILSRQTYNFYRQREKLDRHRQEMTNALAHDLKTPLSIISGYAQNLMENINTDKREHYAANIKAKVDQMDEIILDILELSKLEHQTTALKLMHISLNEVCQKIIADYRQLCQDQAIEVQLTGDSIIKADGALIARVITNFFVNALKHTPYGEVIEIRITDNRLEVYNRGEQIPADRLKEIWEPFKKLDTSRGNTQGTGLGLFIASEILAAHQFSYGVENRDDGVVFWFKV